MVQKTVYDLSAPCLCNPISYHFFLCSFCLKHTGLLAVSNMPRTFPFMVFVLAVSSFFLTQMSFPQVLHVSHTHFVCSLLKYSLFRWAFLDLTTLCQIHPVSLQDTCCFSPTSCIGFTSWRISIHAHQNANSARSRPLSYTFSYL